VAGATKAPEAAKTSRPAQVLQAPASTAAAPAPAAPVEAPAERGKGGHGGGDHPHGGAPGQDQRQDAGQDKGNGPKH
jgi:hypothetical protein